MVHPDHRQDDRLAPETVHELLAVLTVIRGHEHLIKRWVRLRDDTEGSEKQLKRLDQNDALIQRLAAEVLDRVARDGTDTVPDR